MDYQLKVFGPAYFRFGNIRSKGREYIHIHIPKQIMYIYIYVYIHSSIRTDGIRGHSSPQHAVPATSNYVLPVATFSNVIKSILSFESLFIPGFSFSLLRCGGSEDEAWTDRVPCPETPKTPKFLTHFRPSCVLHILQICRICLEPGVVYHPVASEPEWSMFRTWMVMFRTWKVFFRTRYRQ